MLLRRVIKHVSDQNWLAVGIDFMIVVVGVSGGVRIHQLELFLQPPSKDFVPPTLGLERWILEIYRTVMESLQSIAWMLLVFFVFTLIAYVLAQAFAARAARGSAPHREQAD